MYNKTKTFITYMVRIHCGHPPRREHGCCPIHQRLPEHHLATLLLLMRSK